jgi:large subunit ribosomal protein L30
MGRLKITWVRSDIGFRRDQRRTLRALGFHRLNETIEHEDSLSIKGMINKVKHLVTVEEHVETE